MAVGRGGGAWRCRHQRTTWPPRGRCPLPAGSWPLSDALLECARPSSPQLDPNPHGEEWWVILAPSYFNFFRLQFTPLGTYLMNKVLNFMELIRLGTAAARRARRAIVRHGPLGAHASRAARSRLKTERP